MLLLVACTPVALDAVVVEETAAPVEDTSVEHIPGTAGGVCRMELECSEAIADEPKVTCDFKVEDGDGWTLYDGQAGVELRGRSSSGFNKKQYGIELRDGEDEVEVNLLDMGAESDWVLNGAYIDRAFVRNKMAFDLFQSWGGAQRYAPESRNCTLRLNGGDQGIYFLAERIKRDAARLDLPAEGSMIVKLDDQAGVYSNEGMGHGHWKLVYPPAPTVDEQADVVSWFQGWEAAVHAGGVFDYIDRDSAIDFLLLQEFMKNNDAYYLSVHLWREPGGLAFFTPWDLDLSFGQPTYNDNVSPLGWLLYRPTWVKSMVAADTFRQDMAARWAQLRQGELAEDAVLARFDAQVDALSGEIENNFDIWAWEDIDFLGGYLPEVEDHEQEVENIRAWIPDRLDWMDENIAAY